MAKNVKTPNTVNSVVAADDLLPETIHILPIRVRPIFPGIITPLIVPPGKNADSMEEVIQGNGVAGLCLLKDEDKDNSSPENLYQYGTAVRILKKINLPDGGINILVSTLKRMQIKEFISTNPYLVANVSYPKENNDFNKIKSKALVRTLLILTRELAQNNPLFTEEMKLTMVNMSEPGKMADFVCSILNLEKEEYQKILEIETIEERLESVIFYLKKEIELVGVQKKIQDQINDKMDKQQRQFFLREQLKAIQSELGNSEDKNLNRYRELAERLKKIKLDSSSISEVEREIDKLSSTDLGSADYNVIRNYLDTLDSLPWEDPALRDIDMDKAKKILNRDHYKLDEVKERILEFLAVKKLYPESKGAILCLSGPPGVGKTSVAKSIAESMGRKFFRFSLGGIRDEAEIKGHRRTYIGAMPGKIIQILRIVREKDPVILLDEVDKVGTGIHGDPASALLEVLDPEQNSTFRDHYIDLPFDLSKILFIATANHVERIPRVLIDRMDVIPLSGYITEEKIHIFDKYLWKKEMKKNGLEKENIKFSKDAVSTLINSYSRESGLRGLERMSDKIARKIAYKIVTKTSIKKIIEPKDLKTYLGEPTYAKERMTEALKPGTALGLAWTSSGGATLLIETIFTGAQKTSGLILTGKLGKTMNESAAIAQSFIKSILKDTSEIDGRKIHIHVPDGATPKDGPSAGITIASAILSLYLNAKVNSGYAMTGEITLTGEVLEIGGLREKIVAARRVGIKKIIFPADNQGALSEIPDYVKKGIRFFPVKNYKEVALLLFEKKVIEKNTLLFMGRK